ncbi:MAG: beta strand repeat-containing protein, partial [Roseimicrobium sp.]
PNASGAKTTLQQTGTGAVTFTGLGYNSNVSGADTSITTFNGGTWNIGQFGQNNSNAQTIGTYNVTNAATVNVTANGQYTFGTYNVTNGSLNFQTGVSQGNNTSRSLNFTVNNSGGGNSTISVAGGLTLGNAGDASANTSNSLTVGNGGTVNITASGSNDLNVGPSTAQTGTEVITSTLNVAAGGKLMVQGSLRSSSPNNTSYTNTFNWTGGQVTALNITAGAGFTATGALQANSFTNSSGTLAPGDIGTPGRTNLNGPITTTTFGASSTTAIDIGGTNRTASFQDTVNAYDSVQISPTSSSAQTLNVGGRLALKLVSAFVPTSGNTFDVIASSSNVSSLAINGTFSNQATATVARGNTRVGLAADGLGSFRIAYDATNKYIRLSDYQADNQWTAASGSNWSAASAASWSVLDPNGADYAAKFADGPSAGSVGVNLDANRTVQGLLFSSNTRNYSLTGSGTSLTLDNGYNATAAFITDSSAAGGNHVIGVPVVLNSDLNLNVATSGEVLTLSGNITESSAGRSVTKLGAGTTVLTGTNGYTGATLITEGTLQIGNGGSIAAGSALAVNGNTAVLAGTGTVNGTTTVNLGQIRPGDSSGTFTGALHLAGGLTFNPTSDLTVATLQIGGAADSDIVRDRINVLGSLNLAANGNIAIVFSDSFVPAAGQSYLWDILDWTSLNAGTFSAGTNLRTSGLGGGDLDLPDISSSGSLWDISNFLNNGTIAIVAVPEPSRAVLLLIAACLALSRRRRSI